MGVHLHTQLTMTAEVGMPCDLLEASYNELAERFDTTVWLKLIVLLERSWF